MTDTDVLCSLAAIKGNSKIGCRTVHGEGVGQSRPYLLSHLSSCTPTEENVAWEL